MKKAIALAAAFVILTSLCACGNDNKAKGKILKDNGISSGIEVEVGN